MDSYASLQEGNEHEDNGVLIRVVEPSSTKWNHIENLDKFFQYIYVYHQKQGFICILYKDVWAIIRYIFIVLVLSYHFNCIEYNLLIDADIEKKVPFSKIFCTPSECIGQQSSISWFLLFIAFIVGLYRSAQKFFSLLYFWNIKQFFNQALEIPDWELNNLTWHDIQTKVRSVQLKEQMCIQKRELSDLDIYQRILRQDNYLVALVNKQLLPPRITLPLIGEFVFWTQDLEDIIRMLLFRVIFKNPFEIRDEYKISGMRIELANNLKKWIRIVAFLYFITSPIIFIWKVFDSLCNYVDAIKREPGIISKRKWTPYGRVYLRHFNELEHELNTRLYSAYRHSTRYLSAFNSPLLVLMARNLSFVFGTISGILIVLTLIDRALLLTEFFPLMAVFGTAAAGCRLMIDTETTSLCQEALLANVVEHIHYLPLAWKGQAHTAKIRDEFQQLLQPLIVLVFQNIFSPILTPYALWRVIAPRSLDIVDFYRNFTVTVSGVGDVCGFALMDVRKHGNPHWQNAVPNNRATSNHYTQAEDGKTEMSLIRFTQTNPTWKPPEESQRFIEAVRTEINNMSNVNSSGHHQVQISVPLMNSADHMLRMNLSGDGVEGCCYIPQSMGVSVLYLHENSSRYSRNLPEENTPLLNR